MVKACHAEERKGRHTHMKHETAAYSTCCALAAALKRIMAQKPVEHVTVS